MADEEDEFNSRFSRSPVLRSDFGLGKRVMAVVMHRVSTAELRSERRYLKSIVTSARHYPGHHVVADDQRGGDSIRALGRHWPRIRLVVLGPLLTAGVVTPIQFASAVMVIALTLIATP